MLFRSVQSMLALTFGDTARRQEAIDGIRAIHRRVHGRLPAAVGPFAAGTPYSADDPNLLLWVHATLLDSIPLIYERVVGPLSDEERDRYCVETAAVAIDLGARDEDVPRSWPVLQAYMATMYGSGQLAVSPQARELADAVLSAGHRSVTLMLLPIEIRRAYGYSWDDRRQRQADLLLRLIRGARRSTPRTLALWADARR